MPDCAHELRNHVDQDRHQKSKGGASTRYQSLDGTSQACSSIMRSLRYIQARIGPLGSSFTPNADQQSGIVDSLWEAPLDTMLPIVSCMGKSVTVPPKLRGQG
jgi:hypothetical protein